MHAADHIFSYSFFALLLNTSVEKAEEGMYMEDVFKCNSEIRYRKGKARVQIVCIKADELLFLPFFNTFCT